MTTTEQIKALFETFIIENEKFEDGNNNAGRLARNALNDIGKLTKVRRAEIQELKKSRIEARRKV